MMMMMMMGHAAITCHSDDPDQKITQKECEYSNATMQAFGNESYNYHPIDFELRTFFGEEQSRVFPSLSNKTYKIKYKDVQMGSGLVCLASSVRLCVIIYKI